MRASGATKQFSLLFTCVLLVLIHSCKARQLTAADAGLKFVSRADWGAVPAQPYKSHKVRQITVHHEGTLIDSSRNVPQFIRNIQRWGMGKDRNWTDVPYHFFIGPDGRIYEGRNVLTVGETATEYDPSGHLLICCLGNFEKQEVPPAQLEALVRLLAWASKRYAVPLANLATHRDHSNKTTCPGKNLYHYFADGSIARRAASVKF